MSIPVFARQNLLPPPTYQQTYDRYRRQLEDTRARLEQLRTTLPLFGPLTEEQDISLDNKTRLINSLTKKLILDTKEKAEEASPAQEGNGLLRNPNINPPKVRKLLEEIGNEEIRSIKLVRTPLSSATKTLLNIASFFTLDKTVAKIGVDKFFHLSMLINGKYVYEKNEVINMTKDPNIVKSNSETLDVPIDKSITINELVSNTQAKMKNNYAPYNARDNNCSIFISNVLDANGLQNQNTKTFLSQKTQELFDGFPSLTKNIVDLATTAGAVVDKAIQGEGANKMNPLNINGSAIMTNYSRAKF